MAGEVADAVLCDSCFWIALFDESDQHHARASEISSKIQRFHLYAPWPVLYETLSTRMARRPSAFARLLDYLERPGVHRLMDEPYREAALARLRERAHPHLKLSLADAVLRHLIADRKHRIDYMVTFNKRDFFDVCNERAIEIYEA